MKTGHASDTERVSRVLQHFLNLYTYIVHTDTVTLEEGKPPSGIVGSVRNGCEANCIPARWRNMAGRRSGSFY